MTGTCKACGQPLPPPAPFYTITPDDVGKHFLRAFGKSWSLSDSIGYVMRADIGKRVYQVPTEDRHHLILQIESTPQRDKREDKRS